MSRLLTNKQIASALENTGKYGKHDLSEAIDKSDRAIAKKQDAKTHTADLEEFRKDLGTMHGAMLTNDAKGFTQIFIELLKKYGVEK